MKKIRQNYYLGFDIGTNSVGWAVTDENYQILRFNGKLMWGSRLFDEAETAQNRRQQRTARRRLQRRHWRIELLQELFAEEISKVDPGFFQRLKDGALLCEDKKEQQWNNLFNDESYKDVDYHTEYPTIYHLRKALLTESGKKDIRLVYLAIHHILKHRGHFLFSGTVENVTSFHCAFQKMVECLNDEFDLTFICSSEEAVADIIKDKHITKRDKANKVLELLDCDEKSQQKQVKAIISLICGSKVKLSDIFADDSLKEAERSAVSFSESSYDDIRPELEDVLQERCGVLDILKGVYDWGILADILKGGEFQEKSYLSIAKVKLYDKHHEDLKRLKSVLRKYDESVYRNFFQKPGSDNYCAYIGSTQTNGKKQSVKQCTYDVFSKAAIKILSQISSEKDQEQLDEIIKELEAGTFLPLQVSKDNGVIPYQVHGMELREILRNCSLHYEFLNDKDETGYRVSEKIIQLFEFRIPYYVGPLNTANGKNSWMVRRSEGKIYPWNFEEKVDVNQSAEKFIRRMTNKCTYLVGKDVLPKNSLLYSEFMVLNEINNLKICNESIPVELKEKIFYEVFQNNKKVSVKILLSFLQSEGIQIQREQLSGFDQNFKTSLGSYMDMKKIFGEDIKRHSVQMMIEDLILWITLYGDAPKMLKNVIRNHYDTQSITDKQIEKVCRLKYQGWGRLSKEFLTGIQGASTETGEVFHIIGALHNTNDNLMQLLSQRYTFQEEIEKLNRENLPVCTSFSYDNLMKDTVASPAIKRAAWQVVLIAEEVRKIMGKDAGKIFIEMAREPQEKKATDSRKTRLIQLYSKIKEESRDWKAELENRPESDFRSIKLYLYYTQMGKCMYSGESIDLSLLSDATVYDRDHIYPQSKTKDDSLDNLVLVKRELNAKKDADVLSEDIRNKMTPFWSVLKEKGLITSEKYRRLTRTTPLTDEELAGFINRQLVETRQSSKVVAELFQRLYQDTEVVYVKAKAVSDFRHEELKTVKSRTINDYHHAKDAYLNIVVGNVYHEKFTRNPLQWLKSSKDRNYSLNALFHFDLIKGDREIWKRGKDGTIKTVLKFLRQRDIRYTRYATENKSGQNGGLFDSQIVGKHANASVPVKKGLDVNKYGGYKTIATAYFSLVASKDKKGNIQKSIEAVPLYLKEEIEKDSKVFLDYCKTVYGLTEPQIVLPRIKKDSFMIINSFPMHLRGTTGKQLSLQGAVQLILDDEFERYVKKIEKYIARNQAHGTAKQLLEITEDEGITLEKNIKLYDELYRKQKETIYRFRPASQCEILKNGKEKFTALSIEEQCLVLNEILHLLQCKPIKANLKKIGGSSSAGNIQTGKVISKCSEAKLIHQSVTGLFEQEIDLLAL